MAPGTELDIATLTDTAFQATEPQGEIYLRVAHGGAGRDLCGADAARPGHALPAPGRYGVVAGDTQNPTTVTVIEGSAQIEGPGVSLSRRQPDGERSPAATRSRARSGRRSATPSSPRCWTASARRSRRASRRRRSVAAMPGGEDLAQYGSWSDSPEYGQVWYPQVAPDWVPYRDGRWAYVAPWGWTWVDSAPWGFAPFHYGRWARSAGAGAGSRRRRGGRRAGLCAGAGDVLRRRRRGRRRRRCRAGRGPDRLAAARAARAYHPWYRASDRYFRQVNIAHVTNVTTINRNVTINNFANRRAATVVPTSAMTASRPVGTAFQRVDPAQLAQARPVFGQQPLRPAPTTVGVTPVVARQLNLPPPSPRPAHRSAGPTFHATPVGHLDWRRRGGGGGSSGRADVAQSGATRPAGCCRVCASIHRNTSVARAGAGADRAARDTAGAGRRRPGWRFAGASVGQSR